MNLIGGTPTTAEGSKATPLTGPPGLSDVICVRIDGLGLEPIIIHGRTADPISSMAHLTPSETSKEEGSGKTEDSDHEYEQINCVDQVQSEDDMMSDLAKVYKYGLHNSPFPMSNPIAKIKKNKSARKAARKARIDDSIFQEVIDF